MSQTNQVFASNTMASDAAITRTVSERKQSGSLHQHLLPRTVGNHRRVSTLRVDLRKKDRAQAQTQRADNGQGDHVTRGQTAGVVSQAVFRQRFITKIVHSKNWAKNLLIPTWSKLRARRSPHLAAFVLKSLPRCEHQLARAFKM